MATNTQDNKFMDDALKHEDKKFIIYDLEGKIIKISSSALKMLNYTHQNLVIGKTFDEIYSYSQQNPNLCAKLDNVRKYVLRERESIAYVCSAEFAEGKSINVFYQEPIFDKEQNIIGSIETLNSPQAYLAKFENKSFKQLTKRQAEVLILLLIGVTYREIAKLFAVSMQTVTLIIRILLDKLGIGDFKVGLSKVFLGEDVKGSFLVPVNGLGQLVLGHNI